MIVTAPAARKHQGIQSFVTMVRADGLLAVLVEYESDGDPAIPRLLPATKRGIPLESATTNLSTTNVSAPINSRKIPTAQKNEVHITRTCLCLCTAKQGFTFENRRSRPPIIEKKSPAASVCENENESRGCCRIFVPMVLDCYSQNPEVLYHRSTLPRLRLPPNSCFVSPPWTQTLHHLQKINAALKL